MTIQLYHHPMSRASTVVWMLEECGVPYELVPVDLMGGAQKSPEHLALNPMGKVPVLVDGGVPITETAAIGVYLADRYSSGRLAPTLEDPRRGPYIQWCFYTPSVVEIGCMAKASGWTFKTAQAGFGSYDRMLATVDGALSRGPWVLGEQFTMADVILGGTMLWMLQFNMIEPLPSFNAYAERLLSRPAKLAANARNAAAAAT